MIALELEAVITNHHIEVSSDRLPANATRAKLIVMYEEESASVGQEASNKLRPRRPGSLRGTVLSMAADFNTHWMISRSIWNEVFGRFAIIDLVCRSRPINYRPSDYVRYPRDFFRCHL